MSEPFHRWTGGKRWLVKRYAALLPSPERLAGHKLIAPFLGGGAVELHLLAAGCSALLRDGEPRLIHTWQMVRDRPEEVIAELARIQAVEPYTRESFERMRVVLNSGKGGAIERAALFLVVLFWGFNGLWRLNGAGGCNVAFGAPSKAGGPPPRLGDPETIRAASRLLQGVDLRAQDFEASVAEAGAGDFVFADPPYDPLTATACFTGYGRGNWGVSDGPAQGGLFGVAVDPDEQHRLARCLRAAADRGALIMTTNHAAERIRRLYHGWEQVPVEVARTGSCDADRKPVTEIIVRNYR